MNIVENSTFKINPNFIIEEKYIGNRNSKIAIIHDVFEKPNEVFKYIKSFPVELNKTWDTEFNYDGPMMSNFTPGYIGEILTEARPIRRVFNHVLSESFNQTKLVPTMLRLNSFIEGTIGPTRAIYPHSENAFSGTLYLSEKNFGGTGFYRFKNGLETALGVPPSSELIEEYNDVVGSWKYTGEQEWMPIKGDENWEMYHMEEMKWNKLIIYEGDLFHNVVIEPGNFKDSFRTSFNIFSR